MQNWDEFEWDAANESHIAKHRVDRYEAEYGNPRYTYIGKTEDGRILFMVVDRKRQRRFRIGSARDAKFPEKRYYRRQSRGGNR